MPVGIQCALGRCGRGGRAVRCQPLGAAVARTSSRQGQVFRPARVRQRPALTLSEIAPMNDAGVGRLLVASLHQGIAGRAADAARFLRVVAQSGRPARRAHRSGADGRGPQLPPPGRRARTARSRAARASTPPSGWCWRCRRSSAASPTSLPPRLRLWYVMRLARRLVRQTYGGSRAIVRWRAGGVGAVDLRGSLFCQVREPTAQPLCQYYAAAIDRLTALFGLDVRVRDRRLPRHRRATLPDRAGRIGRRDERASDARRRGRRGRCWSPSGPPLAAPAHGAGPGGRPRVPLVMPFQASRTSRKRNGSANSRPSP